MVFKEQVGVDILETELVKEVVRRERYGGAKKEEPSKNEGVLIFLLSVWSYLSYKWSH